METFVNPPLPKLSRFKSITPRKIVKQEDILHWLSRAHAQAENLQLGPTSDSIKKYEHRLHKFFPSEQTLQSRGVEVPDIDETDWQKMQIYQLSAQTPQGIPMESRMEFFLKRSNEVFAEIYQGPALPPHHLIHVTCTGYCSPSAAQRLVQRKNWNKQTQVTHAYHMGCYAALPSIRIARAFWALDHSQQIDLVHTEICGLHLNPSDHSPEQMVVQGLFADGHIKYSVESATATSEIPGLLIHHIQEEIIPSSEEDMTWLPAHWGMKMTLSRHVPEKLSRELAAFVSRMLAPIDKKQKIYYAIHPGGPRIIDLVQDLLHLENEKIAHSRHILRERGNMSSATLPHIWQQMIDDQKIPHGALIVSLAFGPGLSLFGGVFEKYHP